MKILAADFVLPISSDAIIDGAVAIEDESIVAVGGRDNVRALFPAAEVDDLGQTAILPGFVNSHAHVELTALRGALDDVEHNFREWLLKLNALRASMTVEDLETAATAGALEAARAGVTCVGDIGRNGGAGLAALKTVGLRGIVYQESEFCPDNKSADDDFERLREKFLQLRGCETKLVKVGLSPHSPYTVSRKLFERLGRFAEKENVKISIHAAESLDEAALMQTGLGFFVSLYEKYGVQWDVPRCTSIEFLEQTGVLQARPLLAHCITVSDRDIEIISSSGSAVAHCPKSNAKFGHGYAPLEKFLEAGIAVGLGSDSVASNNVVDLLEEARSAAFAARNRVERKRSVTAREVLELATLGGAKALGLADSIGSIEPGKKADLVAVGLQAMSQQPVNDIYATLVFSSGARDVIMTMVSGREIYREGRHENIDVGHIQARLGELATAIRKDG